MFNKNRRLKSNTNINLIRGTHYRGLSLVSKVSTRYNYAQQYLDRTLNVMDNAERDDSTTSILRFDLHYPEWTDVSHAEASENFSYFIESLKAQIRHHQRFKPNKTKVRYIAIKEVGKESGKIHFHVALILNHSTYSTLGMTQLGRDNLFNKIVYAWARTLREYPEDIVECVHKTKNHRLVLHRGNYDDYAKVFRRLSYFSKVETKEYHGAHNFFSSRG